MRFSTLYPNATEFEEVQRLLFKNIVSDRCLSCKTLTTWLTYQFADLPVPVCGEFCLNWLANQARDAEPTPPAS